MSADPSNKRQFQYRGDGGEVKTLPGGVLQGGKGGGGRVSDGGRGQGSLALGAPGTTEGGRGRAGGP